MLHDHGRNKCEPKRLRVYMFVERKSQFPEVVASGVRAGHVGHFHDMLQVFTGIADEDRIAVPFPMEMVKGYSR